MSSSPPSTVWVITGCATGLGRELARCVISRGHKVIATARSTAKLQDLQESCPDQCKLLQLDVTDSFEALAEKAKQAVMAWGTVDVIVNNAGYSLASTIEEAGGDGFMEMYRTNVFGVINVTNAFLPYMRARRSGTVVMIGSRSGWRSQFPTNALYGSSKAAMHAIADALAEELRPFNIRVLNVVPGGLRTAAIDHLRHKDHTPLAHLGPTLDAPMTVKEVPEYAEIRNKVKEYLDNANGKQPGDPRKAAAAIVDIVCGEGVAVDRAWNGTLFLGSDAERDIKANCDRVLKDLEEWKDVVRGIDF